MALTLPMALALIAGLGLLTVGAAATTMGGGFMGFDHASMMADGDHEAMMEDHDHESMTAEECEQGAEAHQTYMEDSSMEGGDHCD